MQRVEIIQIIRRRSPTLFESFPLSVFLCCSLRTTRSIFTMYNSHHDWLKTKAACIDECVRLQPAICFDHKYESEPIRIRISNGRTHEVSPMTFHTTESETLRSCDLGLIIDFNCNQIPSIVTTLSIKVMSIDENTSTTTLSKHISQWDNIDSNPRLRALRT